MDYVTLIFLVAAVIIFFRLRSVLGQRTGHERSPLNKKWPVVVRSVKKAEERKEESKAPIALPPAGKNLLSDNNNEEAAQDSALTLALKTISAAEPAFDPVHFLTGAKLAYEIVVSAFARGDRESLRPLLSVEMFNSFDHEIAAREKKGETVDFHFIGITKAQLAEAGLKDDLAQVGVLFVSKLVQATRDAKGEVIEGDATAVTEVSDIWTFERPISSRDPNWKLVATEDA